MNRKPGHIRAGLRRRVRADTACRSKRRAFLVAAATWPAFPWISAALAQTKQAPVLIGWLNGGSRERSGHLFAAFKEGLAALGWKEGSNYVLDERWAAGRWDRLQPLAEDLAARKPAIIVAAPLPAVIAAAKAAPKTPIVIATGADPVAGGIVASLARPGGLITGLTNFVDDLAEKYLELLLAAAPKVKRVGFLADPNATAYPRVMDAARRSVARHAVEARFADAGKSEEIEPAISRLAKEGVQGLVVLPSAGLFAAERGRIIKFALAQRWPMVAGTGLADEGALLSYGVEPSANYRRAAYYVDRILKGTKPADLPIEQPTKFELVLNLKTAKALKLDISRELAVRADRVIE